MIEILIFVATILLDQFSKRWAASYLVTLPNHSMPIIKGVFNLTYVENRGAAFGMLQNQRVLFLILTSCAMIVMAFILIAKRKKLPIWIRIALVLMLSGAMGNFIDRLSLGYVRDMFDFSLINFAVFNVADSCVTVAAILLLIYVFFIDGRHAQKSKETHTPENFKNQNATLQSDDKKN